jgi:hypothetical protein
MKRSFSHLSTAQPRNIEHADEMAAQAESLQRLMSAFRINSAHHRSDGRLREKAPPLHNSEAHSTSTPTWDFNRVHKLAINRNHPRAPMSESEASENRPHESFLSQEKQRIHGQPMRAYKESTPRVE